MGAMADALVAYARPLLDQTDGSEEQMNKAFAISSVCYNLAMLPADEREKMLAKMQGTFEMDDEEFVEFRRTVVIPMIERHEEMFPGLHGRAFPAAEQVAPSLPAQTRKATPGDRFPGTDRYALCPCGSGEKYKFCCGSKRR
jgi:hypothetical protein